MPATYSINDNTVYEATRVASVSDALNLLPDNTSKLIAPRDVRDAIFSAWESSVFKQTTGSASVEYIGIDRDNIRNKFLIGKKRIGGLDVLNSTLLNYSFNDTDIFFFNNKPGVTPSNTKISFLAGTNSYLYPFAPYFNAYSSTSSTLNLDIVNETGDIIFDGGTSGRIGVNNVIFPTKLQTASASNGQILKYNNGALIWADNVINLATIGSTSSITNIFGSPVLINGFNMELTDSNPIIATFGHIPNGQTFSNAPIVEVVRQMLYPYLKPDVSLLINSGGGFTTSAITEVNSPIFVTMSWSITKNSDDVIYSDLTNILSPFNGGYPGYTVSVPGLTSISSPPYYQGVTCSPVGTSSVTYTLTAQDSGVSNYNLDSMSIPGPSLGVSNVSTSVTLESVYPFFYGFTSSNVSTSSFASIQLSSSFFGVGPVIPYLNKIVEKKSNKEFYLSGTGYIYICYPAVYGNLTQILDQNGFDITSSFIQIKDSIFGFPVTYANPFILSPSGYWPSVQYIVYKHGPTTVVPSVNKWQFKF